MAINQWVHYLVVVPETRQNEAVKTVTDTFSKAGRTVGIQRNKFPMGSMYLQISCTKDLQTVTASFASNPPPITGEYVELATWHDIATIPLMHPAIFAAQNS